MSGQRCGIGDWRGPFQKWQAVPYGSGYFYRAEIASSTNVYYYIAADKNEDNIFIDIVFNKMFIKKSLTAGSVNERFNWIFQQDSGEYTIMPRPLWLGFITITDDIFLMFLSFFKKK